MNTRMRTLAAAVCGLAVCAGMARAEIFTWTGTAGADWFNGANWDRAEIPGNGADVVIGSGSVLLTNTTADLASFAMSGGTLTFSNWTTRLSAGEIDLQGGTLTHAICDTNSLPDNTNRVYIVCSNATIGAGAIINVDARGYRGKSVGSAILWGQGPGASTGTSGASYGGVGSWGAYAPHHPGVVYGTPDGPALPGSGAGGHSVNIYGTAGGGAVQIEAAGHVILNGTITANGQSTRSSQGGRGSGGGVSIACRTFFSSNGVIRAEGGSSGDGSFYNGGSGGGGRIVLSYDPAAQTSVARAGFPLVELNARGGSSIYGRNARPGTLFVSDDSFFPRNNAVLHGGNLLVQGLDSLTVSNLTIGDGIVVFPAGVTLTVENDLIVTGKGGGVEFTNSVVSVGNAIMLSPEECGASTFYGGESAGVTLQGNLTVEAGYLYWHCASSNRTVIPGDLTVDASSTRAGMHWYSREDAPSTLEIQGNCMITNFGKLEVYSGATNSSADPCGAVIDIAGDTRIASNATLFATSHPFNGAAPLFRLRSLQVAAGGLFSADARGYSGALYAYTEGSGWGYGWGYGPGGGYRCDGASFGGVGGKGGYNGGSPGALYGSSNAPVRHPGSGGGFHGGAGGRGGGLIDIECSGVAQVDGIIAAIGGKAAGNQSGSGSGGGINIACSVFRGAGRLHADGGPANPSSYYNGGAGGGGRIAVAVTRTRRAFTGGTSVAGGEGYPDERHTGSYGSVCWLDPDRGTLLLLR